MKLGTFIRSGILGLASATCLSAAVLEVGFEAEEGFQEGKAAAEKSEWEGAGTIYRGAAQSGTHSLHVSGDTTLRYRQWPLGKKIAYLDFWVKPVADAAPEPLTSLDADGAKLAFLRTAEGGTFFAYDADGEGQSVELPVTIPLDEEGRANEWIRISVRQDFLSQVWDVYLNGEPAAVGLSLDGAPDVPTQLMMAPSSSGAGLMDSIALCDANPLFVDVDNDGIPDTYEQANGLTVGIDDRLGDLDGDGISNIAEFLAQLRGGASGSGAPNDARFIYVHASSGNDGFSGRLSYRAGNSGPKATIRGGIAAARPGDTVVIMGDEYREGDINLKSRGVHFKFLGYVQLK